jgi:hypothetical protein
LGTLGPVDRHSIARYPLQGSALIRCRFRISILLSARLPTIHLSQHHASIRLRGLSFHLLPPFHCFYIISCCKTARPLISASLSWCISSRLSQRFRLLASDPTHLAKFTADMDADLYRGLCFRLPFAFPVSTLDGAICALLARWFGPKLDTLRS